MSKILLGQSYFLRFDAKLWAAQQPYPPLGTMIAASYLRQLGHEVALFDAMLAESEAEWAALLATHRPDYAILYEDNFNYLSKMCLLNMRQAAFTMLALAREAGCVTIVCGSDATDRAADYLAAGADHVLLGEGELTLAELLRTLEGDGPAALAAIAGLAWWPEGADRPVHNPRRPVLRQIDDLPFPAWDLIDVEKYRRVWQANHGYFSMNMVTTRGCPFHCNWCAKPIWGQRYHVRSPANVAEELEWLQRTYRPDHIWFADDIMGLKPGWWAEFAAEVARRGIRTPFKCLSRADLIVRDAENVVALAEAGCDIIWLGAESGSQRILDAMEKGTTTDQIREAAARLHEAGVKVGFFLQFGYPGETRAEIEQTLQLVRDCQPDDVGMSVSYPLPGTRFYENVKAQLGQKQNWTDSADLDMLYEGPFSTAFYRQLHVVLHKEFRARKGWRRLRAGQQPAPLREVLAIFYRLATLPAARWRLNKLARQSSSSLAAAPHMSLRDAATPSPQSSDL
ncbi:MAG: B12-binding domain-containing radical SAM protein [Anaerolineales bacterium]|nr:B12-binding domain-containing radical SAM protein [Anaerolineales bacterium]